MSTKVNVLAIFTASIMMMGIVGITQINTNAEAKKELNCQGCTIKIEDSDVAITLTAKDGTNGGTGSDGAPGEKGDKGDKGDRGEKGDKGDNGTQGVPGQQGDKGDRGDKGDKGDKGDQGERGLPGQNATVSVINGTVTEPEQPPVVVPPVDNGTGTNTTVPTEPPIDNGTVVVEPPVDNGTVVVPPVDNGTSGGNVTVPIEGNVTFPVTNESAGVPSTGEENDSATGGNFSNDETPDFLAGLFSVFGR